MKLLVVGNSPQSNIYLDSQYVSGYHAEIVLLDNGDIFVTDKNSTNGTYLNGSKLAPDTDVLVRRGDKIVFADVPLDWTRIPEIITEPNVKKLVGLGSHPRNQIHVAGEKVSRFHATIKQNTDGKWYICDHSTNGTTVNNVRIPKDTFVRLKSGDDIRCAGVPANNPVPAGGKFWLYAGIAAAACVLAIAVVFAINKINIPEGSSDGTVLPPPQLYAKYAPSTVLIVMGYHYRVTAGLLDVEYAFGGSEFIVSDNNLVEYDADEGNSQIIMASGFYISKDGLIATNLHVASPWIFDQNIQPVEDMFREWLNNLSRTDNPNYMNYISQVKVEGVVDEMFVINHGEYVDAKPAFSCVPEPVAASTNPEIDVAVVRAMLPRNEQISSYVDLNCIPDKHTYSPGVEIYTLGFPAAVTLRDISRKRLEAVFAEGTMSASNNAYDFGHTAQSASGASGSPVFNKYGQLVGMISSGMGNGYNYAIRAEYVKKLLDSNEVEY